MRRTLTMKRLSLGFLALLIFGLGGCATSDLTQEQESEFSKLFDPNERYHYFHEHESKENTFQSQSETYNEVNAAWLADASMLAYCKDAFVKEELRKVGLEAVFFKQEGGEGTQGIIASDNEKILVIFRGTEIQELQDLFYDLLFFPWSEGGGYVHLGFKWGLDAVWDDVSKHLQDLQGSKERPVWFTGHSLGGALAVIAAGRWKDDHKNQMVSLYTYGAPGVGNEDYIRNFQRINVVRVIDNKDQVAHTEYKGLLIDLEHPVKKLISYTHPPWGNVKKRHENLPAFLADHAPIYYAEHSWEIVKLKE